MIYRGWLKSGLDHMLFETWSEKPLKAGDVLTDHMGRKWIIDFIF